MSQVEPGVCTSEMTAGAWQQRNRPHALWCCAGYSVQADPVLSVLKGGQYHGQRHNRCRSGAVLGPSICPHQLLWQPVPSFTKWLLHFHFTCKFPQVCTPKTLHTNTGWGILLNGRFMCAVCIEARFYGYLWNVFLISAPCCSPTNSEVLEVSSGKKNRCESWNVEKFPAHFW